MWATIALSFGLAMDATAVCAARALGGARRERVVLPLLFGAFQSGMAAVGWLGGRAVGPYIAAWDHLVAAGLLTAIGAKMMIEAWRGSGELRAGGWPVYLALALATSLDAAAAGLALPVLAVAPWIALVSIGTITTTCCAAGFALGGALGHRAGPRLGVFGGAVLVAIAIDLLIRAP